MTGHTVTGIGINYPQPTYLRAVQRRLEDVKVSGEFSCICFVCLSEARE